jgi:hypothetical protein
MILLDETEAGTARTQPCRGLVRWAHRADVLQRGTLASRAARLQKRSSDDRPSCLENPRPAGAESTLTENVASPFHAEPRHRRVCKLDLEGIVAKQKHAPYVTSRQETTWQKIINPKYSQREGREELFERDRHKEPVAGWHSCVIACADL